VPARYSGRAIQIDPSCLLATTRRSRFAIAFSTAAMTYGHYAIAYWSAPMTGSS
jgi:hypothetical protein